MDKENYYTYPLETIFDYDAIYDINTNFYIKQNNYVHTHFSDMDLYEFIFSKQNNTIPYTPAKRQCYTCNYIEECGCIVFDNCDYGNEFCDDEARVWQRFYDFLAEKRSEEFGFDPEDCLGCPHCNGQCFD
jgi:hypothetical protein